MCLAIQQLVERGREEGKLIGVINVYRQMNLSIQTAKQYIMEEYKKARINC